MFMIMIDDDDGRHLREALLVQVIQPQQTMVIKKPVISQPSAQGASVAKQFVLQTSRTPTTGRACLSVWELGRLVRISAEGVTVCNGAFSPYQSLSD